MSYSYCRLKLKSCDSCTLSLLLLFHMSNTNKSRPPFHPTFFFIIFLLQWNPFSLVFLVFLIYIVAQSLDRSQTRLASADKQTTLHHIAFCPLCHFTLLLYMCSASFYKLQIHITVVKKQRGPTKLKTFKVSLSCYSMLEYILSILTLFMVEI